VRLIPGRGAIRCPRIVLGVALLIAFWVILGLGTFFIAISGGIAIPITLLTGNHANASTQYDGIKLNAADKTGRILFGQHCAICHTLAAANAVGKVGPNLDVLQPPQSLVLTTIHNGLSVGDGTMPQGIVVGKQAVDVADFVSKVAGK